MTFIDASGREWLIRIDYHALRRVRDAIGYDFGKWGSLPDLLVAMRTDDLMVCEVSRWILDPALSDRKVSPDEFLSSMRGDCIGKACEAIEDGLSFFFRSSVVREQVAALIASLRLPISGGSVTQLPEGSASTPGPSPSASL